MQVSGRILSLQEQRFRLLTDSGQVFLLTLSRHAPLDSDRLAELHRGQAHVQVQFTGEPNLSGGLAQNVLDIR